MSKEMKNKGDRGHHAGWCVHYCAFPKFFDKDKSWTCGAGIDLNTAWDGVEFYRRPCFLDDRGNSKPNAAHCGKLRRPTTEEIALAEEFTKKSIDRLISGLEAALPFREKNNGKNASDIIECPVCKGKLHLSISAYNSHVHGKCETENCIAWME